MARLTEQLVGHKETLGPLLRARMQGKLASTLLFAGPSGIGKKLAALCLAQALVCERQQEEACGVCGSCLRMEKQQSESLMSVEPEGASIKIEQARDILQFMTLQKLGHARVIVIDQAHLMNPQTANALLKSLEEPPAGTFFLLISHAPASVLPTIRSRSQLVRFRPLSSQELAKVLAKPELGIKADDWLLSSSHGSVEIAQRLTESREDYQELEEATASYLSRARMAFPGEEIVKLREILKDKQAQAFFSGLVQGVVRDTLRLQAGIEVVGNKKGPWVGISESVVGATPRGLGCLAELSLAMENDMARNVDRGLVLENFALEWRRAQERLG